jgi:ribosomal protein S18 acetylase RimI-like enzyme
MSVPTTVHIREATKEDYPALLPIASESQALHAEAHPDLFQRGVAGLPEDYFLGLLESEASSVYVAEFEQSIVGYVIVEFRHEAYLDILIPRDVGFISDITVLKTHQGRGIGHLLFQQCVEWAKARGAISLDLMVWNFNKRAIAFYERHGMKTMNRTMSVPLA